MVLARAPDGSSGADPAPCRACAVSGTHLICAPGVGSKHDVLRASQLSAGSVPAFLQPERSLTPAPWDPH